METYWDAFWTTWNAMRRPDDPEGGPELLEAYHNHLLAERFLDPDSAAKLRAEVANTKRVIRTMGLTIDSMAQRLASE